LCQVAMALAAIDRKPLIRLVVCNTDLVPHLAAEPYRMDTVSGYGEMFWVCNGAVGARHGTNVGLRDIVETTKTLLAECEEAANESAANSHD
jgi:hypothetical protein